MSTERGDACGKGEKMHVGREMRCMWIRRGDACELGEDMDVTEETRSM